MPSEVTITIEFSDGREPAAAGAAIKQHLLETFNDDGSIVDVRLAFTWTMRCVACGNTWQENPRTWERCRRCGGAPLTDGKVWG